MTSCMLEDMAYLLGLTCGRGKLDYYTKKLSIEFPFRTKASSGITQTFIQRDQLIIGVDDIINRVADFTGKRVKKINGKTKVEIIVEFSTNTQTWQSMTRFFKNLDEFKKFSIPEYFFCTPGNIKLCFLKGFADVAGFVTKGNVDQSGRYRVYIEIPFNNWELPIQICRLLQDPLIHIPVQTITWGHPNMRGNKSWAKEHQVKIYAEYFTKIGFTIGYKNQILQEFSSANMERFGMKEPRFCDPTNKRVIIKPINTEENSYKLDKRIRGIHFNGFWQICCQLGCTKCYSIKNNL